MTHAGVALAVGVVTGASGVFAVVDGGRLASFELNGRPLLQGLLGAAAVAACLLAPGLVAVARSAHDSPRLRRALLFALALVAAASSLACLFELYLALLFAQREDELVRLPLLTGSLDVGMRAHAETLRILAAGAAAVLASLGALAAFGTGSHARRALFALSTVALPTGVLLLGPNGAVATVVFVGAACSFWLPRPHAAWAAWSVTAFAVLMVGAAFATRATDALYSLDPPVAPPEAKAVLLRGGGPAEVLSLVWCAAALAGSGLVLALRGRPLAIAIRRASFVTAAALLASSIAITLLPLGLVGRPADLQPAELPASARLVVGQPSQLIHADGSSTQQRPGASVLVDANARWDGVRARVCGGEAHAVAFVGVRVVDLWPLSSIGVRVPLRASTLAELARSEAASCSLELGATCFDELGRAWSRPRPSDSMATLLAQPRDPDARWVLACD